MLLRLHGLHHRYYVSPCRGRYSNATAIIMASPFRPATSSSSLPLLCAAAAAIFHCRPPSEPKGEKERRPRRPRACVAPLPACCAICQSLSMNETREDGLTDVFGVAGALACRQSADTAPFARWVLCRHSATNTSHSIKADERRSEQSGCSPSVMLLLHG